MYIYADDNCLRIDLSGYILADQQKLDGIMRDVVKYMNSQKLKFNFKKTEFVVASPKNHDKYKDLVLNFDGSVVKQQLHARLLGLQVSWDLTHKWYVSEMKNSLIANLNKRLFVLNQLRNECPKKYLKNNTMSHEQYKTIFIGDEYLSHDNVKFCDRVANFRCNFLNDAST